MEKFTAEQAARAEAEAKARGLTHLAATFGRMRESLSAPKPAPAPDQRPSICFIFNNKTWCDGRLSTELSRQLAFDYNCKLIDKESFKTFKYDGDIFLFRNVGRISTIPPPDWVRERIVCMLESERPLSEQHYYRRYPYAKIVVAQNSKLRDMARKLGISNIPDTIIGNGINCEEFYPASNYPEEFTVGATGNFSSEAFDEWKGFGRYIVPACRIAGVKLRWCGWQGKAWSLPGVDGEQVPLEKMNEWYQGLSCLVSMSKSEGCSGVVFESMATGLPVISTRTGWHGEKCSDEILWVNRPEEAAPQKDKVAIEELAHKLWWLKNNPDAARAIGMRARKFAESWPHSRVADQWREVFRQIIR